MINSLSGFAVAAVAGLGTIIGMLLVMVRVEQALVGTGTARGRHRRPGRLRSADRTRRANPRRRSLPGGAAVPALVRAMGAVRRPREVVSAGGPGAMRRPGIRHSFDPPIARGSRRSRSPVTPRR
ncbi:hypothetical protein GCM10009854_24420 [Saccharopolyspora halophila]|uniref:Uncharacterized protein n=1 Tax=Saccharopolyspora halophila TaxID=405551 RepID=A0ABP5T6N9_9PSEU